MAKTIMVVDDEEDIRSSVRSVLEKNGFSVITAVNGDDCLRLLKTKKPDLVLMDIMMPGTPVRDVVPQIKGKVIYLSVVRVSEAERIDLLKSKNVIDFIQKPFDISELARRVKKAL